MNYGIDAEAEINKLLSEELKKNLDKSFYLTRCEHGKYKWDIERLKSDKKNLEKFLKEGWFYVMKTYPDEICKSCDRNIKIDDILNK